MTGARWRPQVAVALGKFGIGSELLMTEPDESTVLFGMELPADRCFHLPRPTGEPGVNQEMRPLDLQILAGSLEAAAFRADSHGAPFSARTQVAVKRGGTVDALLAPPLQNLLGIQERLKHARKTTYAGFPETKNRV